MNMNETADPAATADVDVVRPPVRWSRVGAVLLAFSALAVLLTGFDAVIATLERI